MERKGGEDEVEGKEEDDADADIREEEQTANAPIYAGPPRLRLFSYPDWSSTADVSDDALDSQSLLILAPPSLQLSPPLEQDDERPPLYIWIGQDFSAPPDVRRLRVPRRRSTDAADALLYKRPVYSSDLTFSQNLLVWLRWLGCAFWVAHRALFNPTLPPITSILSKLPQTLSTQISSHPASLTNSLLHAMLVDNSVAALILETADADHLTVQVEKDGLESDEFLDYFHLVTDTST